MLIISLQILNGCVEEEKGSIQIQGKGYFNTIQDAIDASNDGDKIIVYPRIYNESIIINKSISLISNDKNNTIIRYSDNKTIASLIKITVDYCNIDNFTILGYKRKPNSNGIEIKSSNNIINNNIIKETYYGIFQKKSNNNIISNNTIINNNHGFYISESNENKIISNNITKNIVYGLYALTSSNNNILRFNIFFNNSNGIRIKGSKNNLIERNLIKNNINRGIYLCCGARENTVFNNSLINNYPNADDTYDNQWYYNNTGNYWSDYIEKYPDAIDENNDGIWDTPYLIYEFDGNTDMFPLLNPIKIE